MKETVNVSLASQPFTFEQDAYLLLKSYLKDIEKRLSKGDDETMMDVEYRLAEIFREKLPSQMMVVTIKLVRDAMEQMGRPSEFGESLDDEHGKESEEGREEPRRKLTRSLTNRSIAGVCGGIAEFFDIDPTMLRLATLLLILFGGLSIWIYVILWIVIPEQREVN